MSKLDEIKEHCEESDSFRDWFEDGWNRNKGSIDDLINHNLKLSESVQYLLSKLEIAEKTLITLALHAEARKERDIGFETVENVCNKVLQQIRS